MQQPLMTIRRWKSRFSEKGTRFWARRTPFLAVMLLAFAALPTAAFANEKVMDFVLFWLAAPIYAYMMVLGGGLWVIGEAMTWLLNASFDVVNYLPVTVGWQTTRDVMNMIVVIILLVVIFATLFRAEAYYKNVLPKLILAVILVNFSRTITSILIEASNIFTRSLMPAPLRSQFTETILGAIGIQNFWSIPPDKKFGSMDVFAGLLFNMVIFTVLFIALLGVALLFLFRLVALMILTILSPIAFVFAVLPATKNLSQKWWEALTKWLLYGPVAAFFLLLALRVAEAERNQIIEGAINNYQQPFVQEGSMATIIVMVLVISLIGAAVLVSRMLGKMASGAAIKLSKYGASYIGRTAPGFMRRFSAPNTARLAARGASTIAGGIPVVGKPIKGAIDALRTGAGAVTGAGNSVLNRFEKTGVGRRLKGLGITDLARLNPGSLVQAGTVLPQAIMQRMAMNSKAHYDPAKARVLDAISPGQTVYGDLADFESFSDGYQRAQLAGKQILGKTPEELVSMIQSGDSLALVQAAAREAATKGRLGEFATNTEAFNAARPELINAVRASHEFTAEGEAAYNDFMEGLSTSNPALHSSLVSDLQDPAREQAARDRINEEWEKADATGFANAFSVTQSSAPISSPTVLKHMLNNRLRQAGADEQKAARIIGQLSALMGEKGDPNALGMASFDRATKTWSLSSTAQQRAVIRGKIKRTGKASFMKSATAGSLLTSDAAGNTVGLSANADIVLDNLSAGNLNSIRGETREDFREAFMREVVVDASTGAKRRVHEIAYDRIEAKQIAGADKKKLTESLAAVLAIQHAQTGKATIPNNATGGTIDVSIDATYRDPGTNEEKAVPLMQYRKIAEDILDGKTTYRRSP